MRNRFQCLVLGLSVLLILAAAGGVAAAAEKGDAMSYADAKEFLANTESRRVDGQVGRARAGLPRVAGPRDDLGLRPDGLSFGFINREFIEAGEANKHINNYGGEDRLWLSPEGGQFSLWFKPGVKQTLADWYTPPAFNKGAWKVVTCGVNDSSCTMIAHMQFENASATSFRLDVFRVVRLLDGDALTKLFGHAAVAPLAAPGVKSVGYETGNMITNCGEAMTKPKGLVSMWVLGMMNAGPETIVIVPYNPGEESALGPVVKSDYFGAVPPERLKITPQAILFRAEATGTRRSAFRSGARNTLGSIDFQNNVLTLVHFNMPEDPTKRLYMNNMWGGPHAHPYVGDVVNSYNDGPPAPGKKASAPSTKSSRFRRPRSFSRTNRWSIATRRSTSRPTCRRLRSSPRKSSASSWTSSPRKDAREIEKRK